MTAEEKLADMGAMKAEDRERSFRELLSGEEKLAENNPNKYIRDTMKKGMKLAAAVPVEEDLQKQYKEAEKGTKK